VLDSTWQAIFWVGLGLVVYSYLLYPVVIPILALLSRWHRADHGAVAVPCDDRTPVAIVVSAYNEERHIAGLVSNLRALDYPAPVTLYLGSDGSSDRTAAILQEHAGPRVRVFPFERNRGKASVLNDLVAAVTEPIVAFTDANTRWEPDALQWLLRHLQRPDVGVVCGELSLRPISGGDNVDSAYWRIERMLKESESAIGGLLGANGGIYALRRQCFVPIASDTIVDDFCIAMTAGASGWKLVYERRAQAVEDVPLQIRDEFKRRVRIGIGNFQAFFRHPEYLFRTSWATRFCYLSHKVLRWFTPHLLLLSLFACAMLAAHPLYAVLLALQLFGYTACLLTYLMSARYDVPRVLRVPVFLAAMNAAFAVAFYRYVTGQYSGSWKRTAR
jgi:cellulose synthase/poly-beta-1,6-N-acetylglucosamine synthase-like glycosyltransferase